MEQVSMNDGLDGRETIAFGLAAGEVAAFVLALMAAYAVLRSGLPGAIGWLLAALVAAGGALLAWGRLAGRPLLEWALLLAAFLVRTGPVRARRVRERMRRWSAALRARAARLAARCLPRVAAAALSQAGAVVIPLALRRAHAARTRPGDAPVGLSRTRSHVVGFFSLAGGTGRTTLAVEVAAMLAVRGRATAATGEGGDPRAAHRPRAPQPGGGPAPRPRAAGRLEPRAGHPLQRAPRRRGPGLSIAGRPGSRLPLGADRRRGGGRRACRLRLRPRRRVPRPPGAM